MSSGCSLHLLFLALRPPRAEILAGLITSPLEDVLDIIMDSNESKLGADGKPIYDANGKFLKGPNYWKPEPKIRALLNSRKR